MHPKYPAKISASKIIFLFCFWMPYNQYWRTEKPHYIFAKRQKYFCLPCKDIFLKDLLQG
jgi:hypothetical protein